MYACFGYPFGEMNWLSLSDSKCFADSKYYGDLFLFQVFAFRSVGYCSLHISNLICCFLSLPRTTCLQMWRYVTVQDIVEEPTTVRTRLGLPFQTVNLPGEFGVNVTLKLRGGEDQDASDLELKLGCLTL